MREQRHHDVTESGCGKNKGEVSPRERGEVGSKEAKQTDDAGNDPRIDESVKKQAKMRE